MTDVALYPPILGASRPRPDQTATREPQRRSAGPVLMGDIHGTLGGRPTLLVLWAAWEAERDEDGPGAR